MAIPVRSFHASHVAEGRCSPALTHVEPELTTPAAEAAVAEAATLIDEPVTLEFKGEDVGTLAPARLAKLLRFRPDRDRFRVSFHPQRLAKAVEPMLKPWRARAVNARFVVAGKRVRIKPSLPGLAVDGRVDEELESQRDVVIAGVQRHDRRQIAAGRVAAHGQTGRVDPDLVGVIDDPLQRRLGVVDRSRERVLRRQPIVNGDHLALAPIGEGTAIAVVRRQAAEDETAAVVEDQRRCRALPDARRSEALGRRL